MQTYIVTYYHKYTEYTINEYTIEVQPDMYMDFDEWFKMNYGYDVVIVRKEIKA